MENTAFNDIASLSGMTYDSFLSIYGELTSGDLAGFGSGRFRDTSVTEKLYIISGMLMINAKKFNLTSITEPHEVVRKHIIDSLIPLGILLDKGYAPHKMIDVGTGAGFPLLPMAAALSELMPKTTLIGLDATGKKITHIEECAKACGLISVSAIQARAEEAAHGPLREKCDTVVARAVADLPVLMEICSGFVAKGGIFAALKSHAEEELASSAKAARLLGFELAETVEYTIPGDDFRTLVIFRKTSPLPPQYPRRYAEILKKPL